MAMASVTDIDKMLVPTNMNTDAHDANAMIESTCRDKWFPVEILYKMHNLRISNERHYQNYWKRMRRRYSSAHIHTHTWAYSDNAIRCKRQIKFNLHCYHSNRKRERICCVSTKAYFTLNIISSDVKKWCQNAIVISFLWIFFRDTKINSFV